MNVIQGVALAFLGNMSTGTSQVLQKRALERLGTGGGGKPRYKDREWLIGISMSYAGDFLNFNAYAKTNPALLAPLQIISIFTALILANLLLGEVITRNQRNGYGIVLIGVVCIVWATPKLERDIGRSTQELFGFLTSFHFLGGISFIIVTLISMITLAIRSRTPPSFALLLSICSTFGSLTINMGKIVSLFIASLSYVATTSSSIVEGTLNNFDEAGGVNVDFIGPIGPQLVASSTSPILPPLVVDIPTSASVSLLAYTIFLSITVSLLVSSAITQEFFRQKILDTFPVSKFFPIFFASLNATVITSSIYFWSHFETPESFGVFCLFFSFSMSIIAVGIAVVQAGEKKSMLSGVGGSTAYMKMDDLNLLDSPNTKDYDL